MKLIITNIDLVKIEEILKSLNIDKAIYKLGEYICANMKDSIITNESQESKSESTSTKKLKYKPRKCRVCGYDFEPTGPRDKFCNDCKSKYGRDIAKHIKITDTVKDVFKKCPKCNKSKPVSEFEKGAFYCKSCVAKVQAAPKINLDEDTKLANRVLTLPIVDRWDVINKMTFKQKQVLLSKVNLQDPDEAERSFAQEFSDGLRR